VWTNGQIQRIPACHQLDRHHPAIIDHHRRTDQASADLAVEFRLVMLELGLLTALVMAFVLAIYLLRRRKEGSSE